MTAEELLEKIQTDLEALAGQYLADFEVYIFDQIGKLPDERVILNIDSAPEVPRGIGGGGATGGHFEEPIAVRIEAEFPYEDTQANRTKVFSVLEQLKAYVRANRLLTAGGDTSRYATYSGQETGVFPEGEGETVERYMRRVTLVGTWTTAGA